MQILSTTSKGPNDTICGRCGSPLGRYDGSYGNLPQMSIEIVVANLLRCFRLNKAVSPKYGLRN